MDTKGTCSLPVQTTVIIGCLSVAGNLNIGLPCAAHNGNPYGFALDFYNNPDNPSGYYWEMDKRTFEMKK